MLTNYCWVT